jgi:hypothetical protein
MASVERTAYRRFWRFMSVRELHVSCTPAGGGDRLGTGKHRGDLDPHPGHGDRAATVAGSGSRARRQRLSARSAGRFGPIFRVTQRTNTAEVPSPSASAAARSIGVHPWWTRPRNPRSSRTRRAARYAVTDSGRPGPGGADLLAHEGPRPPARERPPVGVPCEDAGEFEDGSAGVDPQRGDDRGRR